MAKFLVVGGAGYVGSAVVAHLSDQGHETTIVDNLSTGHKELILSKNFCFASAGDEKTILKLIKNQRYDGVFHFAAKSLVPESVRYPRRYMENNVEQTKRLLQAICQADVKNFIFSSTCAVYGDPGEKTLSEESPFRPMSPYGESKLLAEKVIQQTCQSHGLKSMALRYFNAAGAEPGLRVGEWHDHETHLIPNVLKSISQNKPVRVYGSDYPTRDGTCVRDYISVGDLARAHLLAMNHLMKKETPSGFFQGLNLGSEKGYSVQEVISAVEKVTGNKVRVQREDRRPGDPPSLVADATLAKDLLSFEPRDSIETIVEAAWKWEQKREQIKRKAVFFDRDGTLNLDPGYLRDPDQVELLPGVESLSRLRQAGYCLFIVSNQSGIGRGLFTREKLDEIHDRMRDLFEPKLVFFEEISFCEHHPDDQCECRKPEPTLVQDLVKRFGIDPSESYFVGDKLTDIQVGINAELKGSLLVKTGEGRKTEENSEAKKALFIGEEMPDVVEWILSQKSESS